VAQRDAEHKNFEPTSKELDLAKVVAKGRQ
jgi:hypothetical protein